MRAAAAPRTAQNRVVPSKARRSDVAQGVHVFGPTGREGLVLHGALTLGQPGLGALGSFNPSAFGACATLGSALRLTGCSRLRRVVAVQLTPKAHSLLAHCTASHCAA